MLHVGNKKVVIIIALETYHDSPKKAGSTYTLMFATSIIEVSLTLSVPWGKIGVFLQVTPIYFSVDTTVLIIL